MTPYEYDPERSLWRPGRRKFLFLLGLTVVSTAIPTTQPVVFRTHDGLWTVDFAQKVLDYIGPAPKMPVTLSRVYASIEDRFADPDTMAFQSPIHALSHDRFELTDGFHITFGATSKLRGGSLHSDTTLWTTQTKLGNTEKP